VIFWSRHLSERRLFDSCMAERHGERLDPPVAEHLADCGSCHERYVRLGGFLEELWLEADTETGAVFDAEHLRTQQQQIGRRIAQLTQSARVISFPRRDRPRSGTVASRFAPRWAAATAAASLFVGIAVGVAFERRSLSVPTTVVAPRPASESPAPAPAQAQPAFPVLAANDNDDGTFMSELEVALEQPNTPELMALDALTPHVRGIPLGMR
jgi:hypothetical protein